MNPRGLGHAHINYGSAQCKCINTNTNRHFVSPGDMTFRFKQKKTDHPVRNSSPVSDYAKQHDGVPKRGGLVRQESQHSLPEIDITPTTPSEHSVSLAITTMQLF